MRIILIIHVVLIIFWFQVRVDSDLGLADHVWQNKRAAIAQEVEGPQFRQAMHDSWLKYIKATYAAQSEKTATGPSIGQGKVVEEDD